MPAIAYRIYLCPAAHGLPAYVSRMPLWWNSSELFSAYRSRMIDIQGLVYDDSAILLTGAEAADFDDRASAEYASSVTVEPQIKAQMAEIRSALSAVKWVIVEAYEWESGLE